MSGILEIVIALVVIGLIARYVTYILSFFVFMPSELMGLLLFAISIVILLFVIHRKE